ncbi:hypothetical protein [Streptomyces sp. NBC_00459]|uniref:hypothetical protein n=1 Tax=Streptomyces sp. NBC_00459 TaxID=2975749 RepID=UPI002E171B0B
MHTPTRTSKPGPTASPAPVSYPPYHVSARKRTVRSGPSLVSFTLLVTVPAVIAVAALRPR